MILHNTKSIAVITCLSKVIKYNYLPHSHMDKVKKSLFGDDPNKHPLRQKIKLKTKYLWRQTKYTLKQGFIDLWKDSKWLYNLYKNKRHMQKTGFQLYECARIKVDLLKFIPYSVFLIVPFTEFGLPLYLYLFPKSIPSFFVFDSAYNKHVEEIQNKQEEAHGFLLQKLTSALSKLGKNQQSFLDPVTFKKQFFEGLYQLDKNLNYKNMTSDELIKVADFLGMNYLTGISIINKLVHLFTYYFPKYLYKFFRWLYYLIIRQKAPEYTDPFFVMKDFKLLQFNYFPFEMFKRNFLLYQINRHIKSIKQQDLAFERLGIKDLQNSDIKDFTRSRGITSITCYESLKALLKTQWVSVTTHPKFDENTTLWYSVIVYNFLKDKNKDLN